MLEMLESQNLYTRKETEGCIHMFTVSSHNQANSCAKIVNPNAPMVPFVERIDIETLCIIYGVIASYHICCFGVPSEIARMF